MYVVMRMLSKINLKKENISADLVIWIINKHCLEIPLTARECFIYIFFDRLLSYRLLNLLYLMPWKGWNKVNINQRYMHIACCSSLYVPTHLVSVFIINFPLVSLN